MAGLCEGGNEHPGSLKASNGFVWPFYNYMRHMASVIDGMQYAVNNGKRHVEHVVVVVIIEDVQNVHLLLEYRPHIDVSLTCEHDPKLQEYCVCPQNMPQFDSEGIPNQAQETNKPMILNGPTSRNREGSDQGNLLVTGPVHIANDKIQLILFQQSPDSRMRNIDLQRYPSCADRRSHVHSLQNLLLYFWS
ncbi:hypothetical protein ANN_01130 [Periplaneta americana]|uniref:Uncharacterized protein n=1 Tax=Periplaneta americana TaxID=6978 RepID=A0ABQ8TSQ4_PERAM|nr:hypothetical protein ANN_01130 [Periplaneta americana]